MDPKAERKVAKAASAKKKAKDGLCFQTTYLGNRPAPFFFGGGVLWLQSIVVSGHVEFESGFLKFRKFIELRGACGNNTPPCTTLGTGPSGPELVLGCVFLATRHRFLIRTTTSPSPAKTLPVRLLRFSCGPHGGLHFIIFFLGGGGVRFETPATQ